MYTRKHYHIVFVAVLVMLVLSLLISGTASAKGKPPTDKDKHDHPNNGQVVVPHKDKPEKVMRVNCHSQHAVEAGEGCRKAKPDQPAVTADSQPEQNVDKVRNNPVPAFPALPTLIGGGGGSSVKHMM